MARCTLPFLCLVGLVTTTLVGADPTIYIQNGEKLVLAEGGDERYLEVIKCDLESNNGSIINLYKEPEYIRTDRRYELSRFAKCKTSVDKVNEADSGKWTVITTTKIKDAIKENKKSYNVKVRKVYQEKPAVPSKTIRVYPDQLISIRFNEIFSELKSCMLFNSNSEHELASDNSGGIEKLGHCGFKMVAKNEYSGSWTLVADLKNDTAFYAQIEIVVKDSEDLTLKPLDISFERGETIDINLKLNKQDPKMCYLVDPHDVKYPTQDGSCYYDLGRATKYHEGLWKVYYGFEGMEKMVKRDINIEITDVPSNFKSNILRSDNGDINLLCQVRSGPLKYCSFIRPNGEILHMTMGVGSKKYQYYGNGTHRRTTSIFEREFTTDCGVTIHEPAADDYGTWRCLVKTEGSKAFGRVLNVAPKARSKLVPKPTTKSEDVHVKRGDSLTIKCQTDEVLSYCWLRSPNGTVHSVIQTQKPQAPALKYAGDGLELGDCTAHVGIANDTHHGQWTCHMGIANGPEIESTLKVSVTDSHLIATRETVLLESYSDTDLICHPLPGSIMEIEACRWVSPLGRGINVQREGRYVTETEATHCKLSIRVINYKEDVGKWSCYARFANSEEEEVADMLVYYHGRYGFGMGSFFALALYSSGLTTMSLAIFVIVIYVRRLAAMRNLDEKIILEKPGRFP